MTAALMAGGGCVTRELTSTGAIIPPPPGSSPPSVGTGSQTSVVLSPLCSVPFDGFTLPVVSPDGKYLATQTGVAPDWPSLLGSMSARRPAASGIEVWDLASRDGRRVAQLQRGLILSGSCDAAGFLVEEQLGDGSRRIGRVRWPGQMVANDDGSFTALDEARPEWIVDDGRVNAFPTLGPEGALAWCVREVDYPIFDLAIRTGGKAYEVLAENEWSWMLPVFAENGASLFALRVRDGVTELAHARTSDLDAFQQSLITKTLSMRCDSKRAWQALAPQSPDCAVGPGDDARLVFFHPDLRRMAIWNPADDSLTPLDDASFAACLSTDGSVVVSDPDGLVLHPGVQTRAKPPRIHDRQAVPRPLDGQEHAWILLSPDRRSIRVLKLTLLGPPIVG